jgi:uncharacterized repeat protein (TIGR01451 family)
MTHTVNQQYNPTKYTGFTTRSILLMTLLCLSNMFLLNSAHAQGVAAGTDISNTVVVNYNINGAAQEPIESSPTGNSTPGTGNGQGTAFIVDRKVDLSITSNGDATVALGSTQAELSFTLVNEGNDSQEFKLSTNSTLGTDDFDTSSCTTTVTAVTPGSPLSGVTLPTTGNIKLQADQQASISVKCDIPLDNSGSPILSGETSLLSLLAITEKNIDGSDTNQTTTPDEALVIDTVFSDSSGADDVNRDASHSTRANYIASTSTNPPPILAINKSIVEVKDTSGGSTAVTDSEVTYKIQVTTSGIGIINNVVVTDVTPAEMIYKPTTIKLDGIGLSDNNDSDKADYGLTTANTATINLGDINAGIQHEILLTYIIN